MALLDAQGRPTRPQRTITDEMLTEVLTDYGTRIQALGAQQIHLSILLEYISDKLMEVVPDFEIDEKEYVEFRDKRYREMSKQQENMQKAQEQAEAAARTIREGGIPVDLDLTEIDDLGEEPSDG